MDSARVFVIIAATATVFLVPSILAKQLENPKFREPIVNVTAVVGREAVLECVVDDLGVYRVAWLRVDTQTILTIHTHVITKSRRIAVSHSENKSWYLHIKEVRESDGGWYMCQINTDPMKSQTGYLVIVVPPDIIDQTTSSDMVVQEGGNVSMVCGVKGKPEPTVIWKREEDGETMRQSTSSRDISVIGSELRFTRVNRKHMGAYLCIASNGVPPSVSKRIMLTIHFPPVIWIQYQLIGAYDGQQIILECNSEAYPKSINYWAKDKGEFIPQNEKYQPITSQKSYKTNMKLIIHKLELSDYGIYKCVSKNSEGETDGTINVYRIPRPALETEMVHNKNKGYISNPNELTYQIESSKKDKPGSLFLEENKSASATNKRTPHLVYLIISYLLIK